jgi:hypothetical protein
MSRIADAYNKHKNLKLAAAELGIPWHSLYAQLKREGVPVTGDKLRYGSDRDRLAALAEAEFKRMVPAAKDMNTVSFQAKYDFDVFGIKVDVKCSMPRQLNKKYPAKSWAFSFKKQSLLCDFICCFCMSDDRQIQRVLLVPREFFDGLQTVSVSCDGRSKWLEYEVQPEELSTFFSSLIN